MSAEPFTLDATYAKRLGAIRRDLLWVCDRWTDVHEARMKGTARPWREPTITTEAREQLDHQAKLEKADRDSLGELRAPGETAAPVHVDVLDVLSDVLMRSDMLAEHVAQTLGVERPDHAASAFDDAAPFMRFVNLHLTAFIEDDPEGMDAVSDVVRELKSEMARVLGEIYDGQVLAGLCPFCGGKDERHPVGGGKTLKVHLVWMPRPDDKDHHEPTIVCGGGSCEPTEQECGLWIRGNPAWPFAEWEWLSKKFGQSATC